jgi:hypothetical protein
VFAAGACADGRVAAVASSERLGRLSALETPVAAGIGPVALSMPWSLMRSSASLRFANRITWTESCSASRLDDEMARAKVRSISSSASSKSGVGA